MPKPFVCTAFWQPGLRKSIARSSSGRAREMAAAPPAKSVIYAALAYPPGGSPSISLIPPKARAGQLTPRPSGERAAPAQQGAIPEALRQASVRRSSAFEG
jgi:hypothetical protein